MKRSAVCADEAESAAAAVEALRRLGRGVMHMLDNSDSSAVLFMRAAVSLGLQAPVDPMIAGR